MIVQVTATTFCFVAYLIAMMHPSRALTASTIFAFVQMVMAVGTFALLDPQNPADRTHSWVLTAALVLFLLCNLSATLTQRRSTSTAGTLSPYSPSFAVWALLYLSVAIVIGYYIAVGSSAFLLGVRSALTGAGGDIATTRFNAYASARYLFPGYVNQFKNVLLPGLLVLIATKYKREGVKHAWFLIPLGGVALLGLLGTGQRSAFIMFSVTVFLYLYYLAGKRISRGALRFLLFAICIILVATVALGRSASRWRSDDVGLQKLAVAGDEFLHRALIDQQQSSVAGFRYIYYQPIQNGAEWLQAFTGVLPASRGSDLANRIYGTLFGTNRGTAPPSIWGSVYHNFGWLGVLLFPSALGFIIALVSDRGTRPRSRNTLEVLGVSGVFATLGFWAADSPTFLLNSGILVYAWMWWWGRHIELRRLGQSDSPTADSRRSLRVTR